MYYILPLPLIAIVGMLFAVARFYGYKLFERVTFIILVILIAAFALLYLHYNNVWIF